MNKAINRGMRKSVNKDKSLSEYRDDFEKSLQYFTSSVEQAGEGELNELENSGLMNAFASSYVSTRDFLRKYMKSKGIKLKNRELYEICGELELIDSPDLWVEIGDARDSIAHEYGREQANDIRKKVIEEFYPAFKQLKAQLDKLYEQDNE